MIDIVLQRHNNRDSVIEIWHVFILRDSWIDYNLSVGERWFFKENTGKLQGVSNPNYHILIL